jgi:hypothetical protein
MQLTIEVQDLLNQLIKKEYLCFQIMESSFNRYLLDQYKHSNEYPVDLPFFLITNIYEVNTIIMNYFGKYDIGENKHNVCADIIKYKFWLYYHMHYAYCLNEIVIKRFNTLLDKCIFILKLNDEIVNYYKNPYYSPVA